MAWKFPAEEMHLLIRPTRLRTTPPFKTLRRMGLRRGMVAVDLGCGPGYFAIPAAKIVGEKGRVFACDTSRAMLRVARERAAQAGVSNLVLKPSTEYVSSFAKGAVDFCLLSYVLHEVDDPPRLLREARRLLRPGGIFAIIDWKKRPTETGPPLEDRISAARMGAMLRRLGFSVGGRWSPKAENYVLVGTLSPGPTKGSK